MTEESRKQSEAATLIKAVASTDHHRPTGRPHGDLGQAYRCRCCGGSWWERETPYHKPWCPVGQAQAFLRESAT